jgi:hypothetical protein
MARHAYIHRKINDVFGDAWDAKPPCNTRHDWSVYLGWPHGCQRGRGGCGGPRWILTRPLARYLERTRMRDIELPLGTSTARKMRHWLGLHWRDERAAWWESKTEEILAMTGSEFARKYALSDAIVSVNTVKLVGRRIREPNWWRASKAAKMLTSDLPRAYVADVLGISVGSVGRLRFVLRRERADESIE